MGKTLTLPEHGDIILNTMSQKRKKWVSLVFVLSRVDFWVIGKWHGIPCCCFKLLFRNYSKREQLDEKDIRHCCGNLFLKVSFWKYKVYSQRLQGTLKTAFERHPTVEDSMDQHMSLGCSWRNIAQSHLTLLLRAFLSFTQAKLFNLNSSVRACRAFGGKKCSFFGKFGVLCFLRHSFWDSLFCLITGNLISVRICIPFDLLISCVSRSSCSTSRYFL